MLLRLHLLGEPGITVKGERKAFALTKPALLLLFLACRQEEVSRRELAFLFRADVTEVTAQSYLRKLLFRAKRLQFAAGLEVSDTHVCWRVSTDVQVFQEAFHAQAWQAALDAYSGEFLQGVHADDTPALNAWLELERADCLRMWSAAARNRVHELEQQGDVASAVALMSALRSQNPLDEVFLQTHLRLLMQLNQREQAMKCYQAFCALLKEELNVAPLASTQAIMDTLVQERRSANNLITQQLPAATTRFIGRTHERHVLNEKFQNDACRLVTLVGLGGTGKTRLAIEFARSQLAAFADGAVFIPLEGAQEKDALITSIANHIGLVLKGSEPPELQLAQFLAIKHMLLVLDNFEHLKAHALLLDGLIARCSRLKMLVTSREALELQSEWLVDVSGLGVPPVAEEDVEGFDAVRLFLDRAERMSAGFVRTAEVLRQVAVIARVVEGMPLALELAASWTRGLSCDAIASMLQENIALLEGHFQSLPERQRSMMGVFNASFTQLDAFEQQAFMNLAVFEGSFDLLAAERVANVPFALLLGFMNRSLIRRNEAGRYSMHGLLRQYLIAKYSPRSEDVLVSRYMTHYLQALTTCLPRGDARHLSITMRQDMDNIDKAYALAASREDWTALINTHASFKILMAKTGRWQALERVCQQLIKTLSQAPLTPEVRQLQQLLELTLTYTSWFLHQTSYEINTELYERLLQEETAPLLRLEYRFHLAHYYQVKGRWTDAQAAFLNCLKDASLQGYWLWQSIIYEQLQLLPWITGNYEQASTYLQEWLALSEQQHDIMSIVDASLTLHNRLMLLGDNEAHHDTLLQNALQYCDAVPLRSQALIYQGFGLHYYYQKDYLQSERALSKALACMVRTSDKRNAALIAISLARCLNAQQRFDEAESLTRDSMNMLLFKTLQYTILAEIAHARGNRDLAIKYLAQALDAYTHDPQPIFIVLDTLSCLSLLQQQDNTPEALYLARYVYQHKSCTAPQKHRLETAFSNASLKTTIQTQSLTNIIKTQQLRLNP